MEESSDECLDNFPNEDNDNTILSNEDFAADFNFNPDFFTEKEIDEAKLKRMDLTKETKIKQIFEFKKERRVKTREKIKENKKKFIKSMTNEERKLYYKNLDEKNLLVEENLKKGLNSDYKIIFDLDYLNLMKSIEIKSVASQLSYCYSQNKRLQIPFCFHFSNYKDEIKKEMESMGSKNWYAKFHEEKFFEIEEIISQVNSQNSDEDDFIHAGKQLVYLSPDSQEVLTEVSCDCIYIIGGFVDKPISKYRSLYKANGLNIKSARLPLDDFVKDLTKQVLNINNVVEILGAYLVNKDWNKTIKELLPNRMFN